MARRRLSVSVLTFIIALGAASSALGQTQPDLQVSTVTLPYTGTPNKVGATFTAQYTVTNNTSIGFTSNFRVNFYHCLDKTTANCTYLRYQDITSDFEGNTSNTFTTPTLTVPSSAPAGTSYIRFFVDSRSQITESSETNNDTYAAITLTAKPDLSVYYAGFPYVGNTSTIGSSFNGRIRIRNAGSTAAVYTDFIAEYYYCNTNSASGSSSCTKLGQQTITTNINAGSTTGYITTPNLTIPAGAMNGTRYIRVDIDTTNVVSETNETNNSRHDSISITQVPSDLVFTAVTVPYTGSTSGTGSQFTAYYTLKNDSINGFTTDFYVSYYYCPTKTTATSSCTYLTRSQITQDFAAGATYTNTSPVLTLPNNVQVGTTGTIRLYADWGNTSSYNNRIPESNSSGTGETNNTYDASITVTRKPDLQVSYASFPHTGSTATIGSTFTGRYRIYNDRNTSLAKGTVTVTFEYCPSQSATGCTTLGSHTQTLNLGAGSSTGYITTPALAIPSSAQNGTRYIRVYVDSTNVISEATETNNDRYDAITISQIPSDLIVAAATVPYTGNTSGAGSQFTAYYTLKNDSTNGFTTDFYVTYYYCPTTSTATSSCTYLSRSQITDNFSGGQSRIYTSPTLTLPTNADFGANGSIRIYADWGNSSSYNNRIPESNSSGTGETNNTRDVKINVTRRPDLQINYTSFPYTGSTSTIGATFNGRYRIYNDRNTSRAYGTVTVRFEYCPAQSATGCTTLGTQTQSINLSAGQYTSYITSPALAIPSSAQNGTRYIRVYVDSTNVITEANETNNDRYDAITINQIPSDLIVAAATVPYTGNTNSAGSQFTAYYTLKNDSTNGFTTNFYVAFYYCPTTATATSSCTYLTRQQVVDDFSGGQSRTYTTSTLTLPNNVVYGTAGVIRIYADWGNYSSYNNQIPESNSSGTGETNNTRDVKINVTARPDLYVYSSQFPYTGSTAGIGSIFNGRYRIRNNRNTSAVKGTVTVTFQYCPQSGSTTGCIALGSQQVNIDLQANQYSSYITSPSLTIPTGAQNGTAYVRILVDSTNAITEGNENNNDYYDSISVSQVPSDLQVSKITAPYTGTTTKAGSQFTVQYTLTNASKNGFTNNFYVRFYYCTAANTQNCTTLRTDSITDNFSGNQARIYTSGTLTVPSSAVYGTGYIRIFADYNNQVVESNEANNNGYASITVGTRPDLYVYYSYVPYSGSTKGPGSTFTGRYRIRNNTGTSAVNQSITTTYYYCTAANTSTCTKLADQTQTINLSAGSTTGYFQTPVLTLPATVQQGTGYIRAFVDSNNGLTESDETNNNDWDQITVTAAQSDLTIAATNAPASGSVAGAGSTFTVSCSVQNAAGVTVSKTFYLYYYYCTSNNDNDCTQLGQLAISDSFTAGQSRPYTSPSLTLPTSVVYGTGYIRFFVDATNVVAESTETNNDAYDAISVSTLPDLLVNTATVPYTGSVQNPGDSFTGQYTLKNADKSSAVTKDFVVSYYYCTAQQFSTCTLLDTDTVTTDLNAGQSTTYTSATLTLPSTAQAGTRYILARVDSANAVVESDEKNNDYYSTISVASKDPDLIVATLTAPFSGSTKAAGSTFTVQVGVKNDSNAKVTSGFDIAYFYCTGQSASACTFLTTQAVTDTFAANQSRVYQSSQLTLPTTVSYGAGYIRAYVDYSDAVKEKSETNNDKYALITVSTAPDLLVSSSNVPFSGNPSKPGDTFTGQYVIKNADNTSAISRSFSVAFSLCPAQNPSGCATLGTQTVSQNMDAGDTYTLTSNTLTIPTATKSGTYYVRILLDSQNNIVESKENNNDKYDPLTITGTADLKVSSFTASPSGSTVTYSVTVCNSGTGDVTSSFDVELYYNQAAAPDCSSTEDHQWTITTLQAGTCSTLTHTRQNVNAGPYLAWARADADCAITEDDETNNNASATYTVVLPDAGAPDLAMDMGVDAWDGGTGDAMDAGVGDAEAGMTDAEAGMTDTGAGDGTTVLDGQSPDTGATPDTGGSTADVGAKADGGTVTPPDEGGCDCAVEGSGDTGLPFTLSLLLAAALLLVRRRRR